MRDVAGANAMSGAERSDAPERSEAQSKPDRQAESWRERSERQRLRNGGHAQKIISKTTLF